MLGAVEHNGPRRDSCWKWRPPGPYLWFAGRDSPLSPRGSWAEKTGRCWARRRPQGGSCWDPRRASSLLAGLVVVTEVLYAADTGWPCRVIGSWCGVGGVCWGVRCYDIAPVGITCAGVIRVCEGVSSFCRSDLSCGRCGVRPPGSTRSPTTLSSVQGKRASGIRRTYFSYEPCDTMSSSRRCSTTLELSAYAKRVRRSHRGKGCRPQPTLREGLRPAAAGSIPGVVSAGLYRLRVSAGCVGSGVRRVGE